MGFGLLEEMSIAELRERLEYRKRDMEEERLRKLDEINKVKEEKQEDLMTQAEKIANHRKALAQQKQDERDKKLMQKIEKEKRA